MSALFFLNSMISINSIQSANNKCYNCKHFLPASFKGEFIIGYYYGKCSKFLKQHAFTGELEYISIHEARDNEELCGRDGTKFKQYNSSETNQNLHMDFYE